MLILRMLPVLLSFLLLGAHFSRDGQTLLAILALLFPFFLLIKKAWIPWLFQFTLLLGSLEWLRSLYLYIQLYEEAGKSWTRLLFIISGVALFTLFSALVFRSKAVRLIYR